jgi:hypothetical protein
VATGILPVVSTLTFGFAATTLLEQKADLAESTLILVSLSAVCSLYTTTYSVLEVYYVAMMTAGDTKSTYLAAASTEQNRQETTATMNFKSDDLDDLARQVDTKTSTCIRRQTHIRTKRPFNRFFFSSFSFFRQWNSNHGEHRPETVSGVSEACNMYAAATTIDLEGGT